MDKEMVWKPTKPFATRLWAFMQEVNRRHGIFRENNLDFAHISQNNALTPENHPTNDNNEKQLSALYNVLYDWSIEEPAPFWETLCHFFELTFDTPPEAILVPKKHMVDTQWFQGARFNFAEKLLSRNDDHTALISIDEQGNRRLLSYAGLYAQVAACAAGLKAAGVAVGDRIAAVMPNTAETIVAMLATTSLGAIWSSCSPDFGVQALVDRIGQISPKILFITDGHWYLGKAHSAQEKLTGLYQALPSLQKIIVCPNLNIALELQSFFNVVYWKDFLDPTIKHCNFVSLPFSHPLYILFSSGTTGKPKCLVHSAGGTLLQHLKELGLHTNLKPNDNLLFYTTCGWMMWHWSISALALGSTLTLYDGAPTYPNNKRLFELLVDEKVTVFGTSAKFISSIEKSDLQPSAHFSFPKLRTILSTGSPLLPQHYDFVYRSVKSDVQLCSISGGTDIISCFALGNPLLPVYRGELQGAGLGMAVNVFNEQGKPVREQRGELVCTKAFPSMPLGFWGDINKERYINTYFSRFPGVWCQGDFAELTPHNGVIIYGRSDTTLNAGGIRIGTAEIYRQLETIPEITDAVVVDQPWLDDTRIILFVQLKQPLQLDETLVKHIQNTLRHQASPRHVPAKILQVPEIPRTINGKIVEKAVRDAVQGHAIENMGALANPEALNYFKQREELLS